MPKQPEQTTPLAGSTASTDSPLALAGRKVEAAIAARRVTARELAGGRAIVAQMEAADELAKRNLAAAIADWQSIVNATDKG